MMLLEQALMEEKKKIGGKKDISFRNIVPTHEINQFELLDCIIKVNKPSTRLVVVYRPPPSRKNGLRYENFAIEWS